MPEFLSLVTPDEALLKLFSEINPEIKHISVPTHQALGKVITEDVISPQNLPEFKRSTVDGYAVLSNVRIQFQTFDRVRVAEKPDGTYS